MGQAITSRTSRASARTASKNASHRAPARRATAPKPAAVEAGAPVRRAVATHDRMLPMREKASQTAATTSRRAVPAPRSASSDDHLTTYFRDLAVHDLLGPEEERSLSMGIEDQEIAAWELVFGDVDFATHAIALVRTHLEEPVNFSKFEKTASELRGVVRDTRHLKKLGPAAREMAVTMRAADLDRVHIDAVLREADRVRISNERGEPTWLNKANTADYLKRLEGIRRAHSGSAHLRDEFVRANLRLVVTMARRYDRGGMPLADLIQEGNLGLMHAVSRFDYRRGLRFSTYACWWIRHAIGRALADKARAVRIPVHMLEAQQQLEKVRQAQVRELGRPPTPQELAKAARVPVAKLNQMHRYLMGSAISLDKPMHDDDDRALGDMMADPNTEESSPADDMTTRALSAQVSKMLHFLSPIEADVLRKRFGLKDDEEKTFREIGDEYELSRERIRQIQNAALDKLKRAMEREHRGHLEV